MSKIPAENVKNTGKQLHILACSRNIIPKFWVAWFSKTKINDLADQGRTTGEPTWDLQIFRQDLLCFFIYDTIRHYDTRESSTYPMDMFVLCLQWPKKSREFDLNIEVYLKPTWTLNECNKSINGFHLQECCSKDLQNLTKLQQRVPTSYPKSQAHDVVEDNAVDCFGQSISIVSSLTLCPPSSSTSPLFESISLISNDGHT